MTDYTDKLKFLLDKSKKLKEKQDQLMENRKREVAELAFKYDLLALPDAVLAGAFGEIEQAMKIHPNRIKQWEAAGTQQPMFLKNKTKHFSATTENTGQVDQD